MADEVIETTAPETKEPPKIVSAGKPIAFTPGLPLNQPEAHKEEKPAGAAPETPPPPAAPELTDEQLKAFFESKGVAYEGLDKALEKLNYTPATPNVELTPEQKEAQTKAEDKRLLDLYIANGGTVEQFVGIKNILSTDLTELSVASIRGDMKEAGFNEEEITAVLNERYYQIKVEELEQGVDETDEDFATRKASIQKKVTYGASKLANRGKHIQTQAEQILNGLKDTIKSQDLQKQEEEKLASNVDATLAKLPRKITFQLGKHNDVEILPVDHEVSQESIDQVAAILKDPAQRNNLLFNPDDTLNIEKLADLLVKNAEYERALKGALLEGQTRQVAEFEKVFPKNPQALGVGGYNGASKTGQKGTKFVSAGKPVQFQPGRR